MPRLVPLLLLALASGCTPSDPVATVGLLWDDLDANYALFEPAGVDWDGVGEDSRAAAPGLGDEELFALCDEMLSALGDRRVVLTDRDPSIPLPSVGALDPPGFGVEVAAAGQVRWGQQGDFGYLQITGWRDATAERLTAVDTALAVLSGTEGLVLDLRGSSGPDVDSALQVAGRFTDVARTVAWSSRKVGPAPDDFTERIPWIVESAGETYAQPVVVLQDGAVAGAGEWLLLALREVETTTALGAPSAGAAGAHVERTLAQGWGYGVTVQWVVDADGTTHDRMGIPPDRPIPVSSEGDAVLEAAWAVLRRQTGLAGLGGR